MNFAYKTRIAPTPSGFIHEGNALNFFIVQSLADFFNASLLLRIDDLDRQRFRREYLDDIFELCNWLSIKPDYGPVSAEDFLNNYSQKIRLGNYTNLLQKLINNGHLYPCQRSRKQLYDLNKSGIYHGERRQDGLGLDDHDVVWRMKVPKHTIISFNDYFKGMVDVNLYDEIGDFVVRRRDGIAAYHVASLCDDVHYGINLIVRGEDLIHATAAQIYLAQAVGLDHFTNATFAHHPLILDAEGEKLSKSILAHKIGSILNRYPNKQALLNLLREKMKFSPQISFLLDELC